MGKPKSTDKGREYVQRELEQPVEKVLDQKLNDPSIATKEGEQKAAEELKKAAEEATKK